MHRGSLGVGGSDRPISQSSASMEYGFQAGMEMSKVNVLPGYARLVGMIAVEVMNERDRGVTDRRKGVCIVGRGSWELGRRWGSAVPCAAM